MQTIDYLQANHIYIARQFDIDEDYKQVFINRIWIDIEDEVPSKYYDSNITVNQNAISLIVNTLESLRVTNNVIHL